MARLIVKIADHLAFAKLNQINDIWDYYSLYSMLYQSRWRHQMEPFPRYWPSVRGIHRSPVDSPHKGQWRGVLMCTWTNGFKSKHWFETPWAHCDAIVMVSDYMLQNVYYCRLYDILTRLAIDMRQKSTYAKLNLINYIWDYYSLYCSLR